MQNLLSEIEKLSSYKNLMKFWCRKNEIRVSFLVNMTLSKSKSIYNKLLKTYCKGFGKSKIRWLQNQLKLFHFTLIAVSLLHQTTISEFGQKEWSRLRQCFPNKQQTNLEYETMSFISNKTLLKKKWEEDEQKILSQILNELEEEQPKWNEIAIELFIRSQRRFFRNSKQCRQRWLNHLDDSIKHQKWDEEQDKNLIGCVLSYGKKWSQIMRDLNNKRTEHMIKNRFISLVLKYRKQFPFAQEEDQIVKKIAECLSIQTQNEEINSEKHLPERKLRPKTKKIEDLEEPEIQQKNNQKVKDLPVLQNNYQQQIGFQPQRNEPQFQMNEPEYYYSYEKNIQSVPTPTFLSPIPMVNSFTGTFAYFQYFNFFNSQQN